MMSNRAALIFKVLTNRENTKNVGDRFAAGPKLGQNFETLDDHVSLSSRQMECAMLNQNPNTKINRG